MITEDKARENYHKWQRQKFASYERQRLMTEKAVCGSCHSPAKSYGIAKKNDKGQWLISIKPHMMVNGMPCYARIGVTTQK